MSRTHTISLPKRVVDADKLAYFRWGRVGGKVILTADSGEWHLLTEADFNTFISGQLTTRSSPICGHAGQGICPRRHGPRCHVPKNQATSPFSLKWPHLVCVITTLRCNQSCKYCHASRTSMDKVETDMSLDIAKKTVDHAMQSPSLSLL